MEHPCVTGNVKTVAELEGAYDVAVFVDVEGTLRSGAFSAVRAGAFSAVIALLSVVAVSLL